MRTPGKEQRHRGGSACRPRAFQYLEDGRKGGNLKKVAGEVGGKAGAWGPSEVKRRKCFRGPLRSKALKKSNKRKKEMDQGLWGPW
jgi:hypothetical protein